ncbi:MAG: class I SAM-dependent methyltransferase [Candidatus Endonucleobacter sp. (ex Gigantidas childressi)]|nr:class I SAM-dependent methyltransferase [Candidatus Endonucleobacter sp. (ex Gigantidas childressi)]
MIDKLFKEGLDFKLENGKYIFQELEFSAIEDDLDKIKNKLKKFSRFYCWLISVISPVYIDNSQKKFLSSYVNENKFCFNIGSGNSKIADCVYNVDIFAYDNVDVVCDISNLPFKDNSIDVILNMAVLEHVPHAKKVIDEIYRVLKPDGIIYTAFPFIQGFHASPYDFTRVTEEGIKVLHDEFEQIEVKPFSGPTSGMLWIFQEWISILFSFGNKKLHMIIYLIMLSITFPVKFLDYFLIHHPMAKNIASGFIYIGKKK